MSLLQLLKAFQASACLAAGETVAALALDEEAADMSLLQAGWTIISAPVQTNRSSAGHQKGNKHESTSRHSDGNLPTKASDTDCGSRC